MRIFVIVLALLLLISSAVAQNSLIEDGSILQSILDNKLLRCGINEGLPGFGLAHEDGTFTGFDVDICRAIAVAILGDANAVEYIPIAAADRGFALQSGIVDMLSRNTTWTLQRNAEWDAVFGPVVFYDGQSIMVRDSSIVSLPGLANTTICVAQNTTSEANIRDQLDSLGIPYEVRSATDTALAFQEFVNGSCDAFTADKTALIAFRAGLGDAGQAFIVLEQTFSSEPLAPVSPDKDPTFASIIRWVIYGLFYAEELGITSENVADFATSDDPNIRRLLGVEERSGDYLGIPNNFMFEVIRQVGNYAEIFERNLGENTTINLSRGANRLYTDGGLLYAPPFR